MELENSELRPFGRTSSIGPHTSGCRPFEINTFPAVLTLIADFGLVCAQRVRLTAYQFVRVEVRWYHGTRAFEVRSGLCALLKLLLGRRLCMSRGPQPFER